MSRLLLILLVALGFAGAACGQDNLPDNCGRNDDGDVICANMGGDDDDNGGWSQGGDDDWDDD